MKSDDSPRPLPQRSVARQARILEVAALVAAAVGAAGTLALVLYAGRQSPQHLVILLVAGWALSPLAILVLVRHRAARWPLFLQVTLHVVMLFVAAGSLAIYGLGTLRPLSSKPPAFLFVALPPALLLLSAATLVTAWLLAPRGKR